MKKTKGFGLLSVIIIIVVTSLISAIATGVIMLNTKTSNGAFLTNDKDLNDFIDVYETIINKYYDEVDKKGMLKSAEEAMLNYLGDKYTTYLNSNEYDEIIDELKGTYNGIGVTIYENTIISIEQDSPAMKGGLKEGDILIKVNNQDVSNTSSNEISQILKNDESNEVLLEIKRGEEVLNFKLNKENLINPAVSYEIIDNTNVGYIYISVFSDNLKDQLNNALVNLENKGITSLIIDVRDNVGGYLKSAEDSASLFLSKGKIIYSLEANNQKYTYYDETKEKKEYPIVVLINEGSASSSEIFAAALKESYGSNLVGVKSYGKGKVQQVVPLKNGNSMKYTSAKWLTPNGICIDGVGLTPDYIVPYEKTEKYDSQINKALELLG